MTVNGVLGWSSDGDAVNLTVPVAMLARMDAEASQILQTNAEAKSKVGGNIKTKANVRSKPMSSARIDRVVAHVHLNRKFSDATR